MTSLKVCELIFDRLGHSMIEISRGIRSIREKTDGPAGDGTRANDASASDALLSAVAEVTPAVVEGGKKKRKKEEGDEKKAPRPRSFYNDFVASKMAELKQSQPGLPQREAFTEVAKMWALDPKNPKNVGEGGVETGGDEEIADAAVAIEPQQAPATDTPQVEKDAATEAKASKPATSTAPPPKSQPPTAPAPAPAPAAATAVAATAPAEKEKSKPAKEAKKEKEPKK